MAINYVQEVPQPKKNLDGLPCPSCGSVDTVVTDVKDVYLCRDCLKPWAKDAQKK